MCIFRDKSSNLVVRSTSSNETNELFDFFLSGIPNNFYDLIGVAAMKLYLLSGNFELLLGLSKVLLGFPGRNLPTFVRWLVDDAFAVVVGTFGTGSAILVDGALRQKTHVSNVFNLALGQQSHHKVSVAGRIEPQSSKGGTTR